MHNMIFGSMMLFHFSSYLTISSAPSCTENVNMSPENTPDGSTLNGKKKYFNERQQYYLIHKMIVLIDFPIDTGLVFPHG